MKEEYNKYKTDTEQRMPTEEEQHLLRMAIGRTSRPAPDVEAEWEKFAETCGKQPVAKHKKKIAVWMAAAAAAVAFVLYLANRPDGFDKQEAFIAVKGITHEVTVQEDDGKPTVVKTRQLDFSRTTHTRDEAGNMTAKKTVVTTSRGMDAQMTLPDGTVVWLNAESRITFTDKYGLETRDVNVEGEAYFEVKKDTDHPFIVHTPYFTTKVLGTSFNVKAYRQQTAHVVLVSGKVEVTGKEGDTLIMSPGEIVNTDNGGDMKKERTDTYPFVQWKDGFFYFDRTPLADIMRELGRWYNINIVFENPSLMNVNLHFVAEKTQDINDIVKSLDKVIPGKVTIGDNEITLY